MKLPRHLIGKEIRVTWHDPISSVERLAPIEAPKGLAALATWVERGVVDDVTEGVVRFRMSECFEGGNVTEATYGFVPEDLIDSYEIMVPEKLQ
jgi:hypothetical protein